MDRSYGRDREKYADLGAVLWWFLHGNERPMGAGDVIREWEMRIDERIYARAEARRR